mmetsp:Transcript_92524/g.293430  ORF Transcript_92524/g.293430 Transcript_92524/m.293430 type:complete len:292 (+) Transcript_92524:1433-2308(+)
MARATSMEFLLTAASASCTQFCFMPFTSSSTPTLIVTFTMAWHVLMKPVFSASSACFSHMSRSGVTPLAASESMARVKISSTIFSFPCVSSSFAAVTQMTGLVGMCFRASFSTRCASLYEDSFAKASHISTLCGTHSTARLSMTRASASSSKLTASFHRRTELGMNSRALRSTRALACTSCSRLAASIHRRTLCGRDFTALATTALALCGFSRRAASSQTSSLLGQCLQPCAMSWRADCTLPATSSSRAAAIQPGPCLGFDVITLFSSVRAFLMSLMSASDCTCRALRSVR